MTTPIERYEALLLAETFLVDLLNPKLTPKVPSAVRERARRVLRHYPTRMEIVLIAEGNTELLARKRDPELHRIKPTKRKKK